MTQGVPSVPGARLAVVLQRLRRLTGLSLAQLANATTFSKSSWERYLNGKSLPPRSAVKELCRLAGESADHPLALLDIARTHRTEESGPTRETPVRRGAGTPADAPVPDRTTAPSDAGAGGAVPDDADPDDADPGGTAPGGVGPAAPIRTRTRTRVGARAIGHRRATVLTALASVCAVVLGTLVLVNLPPSHREEAAPSPTPTSTPTAATGPFCWHTACQDKDPVVMKCGAEPLTLAEHETTTGAWIQIRYSLECGAAWARMWGAVVGDRVETRVEGEGRGGSRHGARVTSRDEADTYVHTLMSVVSPGTSMRACFSPAAGGPKECFRTRADQAPATP